MGGWLPLATMVGTIALLIFSGAWANRRFADFDHLPGHYDWAGRASRMTPRKTMVWLLPVTFSVMMVACGAAMYLVDSEQLGGGDDPFPWLVFSAVCLLFGQAVVLWLTERWAKQQRAER